MALKDISIFAKSASYRRSAAIPHRHLIRGSSIIRGEQMAEYLGCKYNPTDGFDNDVCIYVKPSSFENIKDGDWVDVMDGNYVDWLINRPGINVIAFSELMFDLYSQKITNKMVLIPQHHCNFNLELRTRKTVKTVGFIGGEIGFHRSFDDIGELLDSIDMNFVRLCRYRTREDVIKFYKNIDIQFVWARPQLRHQAKAPLKVINAASFGIPTVAFPQNCYDEVDGYYAKVHTDNDILDALCMMREPGCYAAWAEFIIPMAKKYHISQIAERYRQL